MKKCSVWLMSLSFLCLMSLVVVGATQEQPKKVTLAMTYIPNVQFAPWYVAVEKGFFKAEGIEVRFDYRMDIDALPLVAKGQLDFAIAGGDQVIAAQAQGIPVSYLACLYAKFPPAILSLEDKGIKEPKDLKGKKIGLPLYGTSLLATRAILKKAGIKESEVSLVDIGYTQIPSLTEGRVDAVVGFANNEPIKLKALGYKVNTIYAWNYFSLVGHGLITGTQTVKAKPKLVQGMVRATIQGMRYALDHPDETFTICQKYLPELGKAQIDQEKQILKASMDLWQNEYTQKKGLGYSEPKVWENSQKLMKEMGIIKKIVPVTNFLKQNFLGK